jgi:hypothetical protein
VWLRTLSRLRYKRGEAAAAAGMREMAAEVWETASREEHGLSSEMGRERGRDVYKRESHLMPLPRSWTAMVEDG